MCALSDPDLVVQADLDAKARSDLYGLFRAGSRASEQPTIRRTFRLATAAARAISGCTVPAVYTAERGRLVRYSGRANRRLDELMEARAGTSGELESGRAWQYALFFRGAGETIAGAFVLRLTVEPSSETLVLLSSLAEPTSAGLAMAELIARQRRQVHELRELGLAQVQLNRTLAANILRFDSHQRIRDTLIAAVGARDGDGESRLVAALSGLTRRSVVLQDSLGHQRAFVRADDSPVPSNLRALILRHPARPSPTGWRPVEIRSGQETVGVIGLYDPDDDWTDDDRFAVEHAMAMIAVELVHHRSIAQVEIRLGRNLADDLVVGTDVVDALARAEMLRFDLGGSLRALLVSWEHTSPNGIDLGAAVGHALSAMRVPTLISRRPDGVLAIVADRSDLSTLYGRLSSTMFSARGTIGVGSAGPVEDLPRSFAGAGRAVKIRFGSRRPYGVSDYDHLGLLRILDMSNDGAELAGYLDEWLGPLLAHDREHHSDLVHTLALYLDSGGNYDRAADALTIHRSTLRYRLGRIRELSGRDLTDPEHRLNLHIAVRAQAALRGGRR
jgi:sugar diacid utilization regulator